MSILKSFKYLTLVAIALMNRPTLCGQLADITKKQPLRYASNFEITEFPSYRIITVRVNSDNSSASYKYALVPRGVSRPELAEDLPIIRTPVRKVAVLETVHIGFMEALDQLDTIVGAATTEYISNPTVRKRIEEGTIQKISTAQTPDIERLLLLKPDLIFISAPDNPTTNIPAQLVRADLTTVITAEYKENHPLARAEWIKLIAALFDSTEKANEIFDMIVDRYEALLKKKGATKNQPDVFCGAPYSGVWHMPGGDSYMAQLIQDAGGNYLWSDVNSAHAIPLDVERVFFKAANADIWLNPSFYPTRQALFAADPRFGKFRAARQGSVYNQTKQQAAEIGNPIWESGILHPDDVLADLIKIFHPDQMSDHKLVYYEKLD